MRIRLHRIIPYGLLGCLLLQGCGLVFDAIQKTGYAGFSHEVDAICRRGSLHVGIEAEPRTPFVFPAIWTDEGARVTGLDVQLIQTIVAALSQRCGRTISPVIHLVRSRDLFVDLNEGKVDIFASAIAANVPWPAANGVAYSFPYFSNAGVTVITRSSEVVERVRRNLQEQKPSQDSLLKQLGNQALAGLTVAVQEGSSFHSYAQMNLTKSRLVLCDSLPAAFETSDPRIDVILGGVPILEFQLTRLRKDWRFITTEAGQPLIFMREHYAVVMDEESYRLRWLVNNLLFEMNESGQLAELQHHWLKESYAYPRRAESEGLPFTIERMVEHYNQGACRYAATS